MAITSARVQLDADDLAQYAPTQATAPSAPAFRFGFAGKTVPPERQSVAVLPQSTTPRADTSAAPAVPSAAAPVKQAPRLAFGFAPTAAPAPAPQPAVAPAPVPASEPEATADAALEARSALPAEPAEPAAVASAAKPPAARGFGFVFAGSNAEAPPKQAGFGFGPISLDALPVRKVAQDESFVGVVERVSIYGDWAVGSMNTVERQSLKITGSAVAHLKEGQEYTLTGRIKNHPSHGPQLDVVTFEPLIRPDVPSMVKFIATHFEGVGRRTAEKFLAQVKDEGGEAGLEALRLKLVNEPWAVTFESATTRKTSFGDRGASPATAADAGEGPAAVDAPEIPYVERMLATRFGAVRELRNATLKLLAAHLFGKAKATGDKDRPVTEIAAALLAQDPYAPMRTVPGYGWRCADQLGKALNIPQDAPSRLSALADYLVTDECNSSGHVFLREKQLRTRLAKTEPWLGLETLLDHAVASGDLRVDEDAAGNRRIYPAKLFETEKRLAEDLHGMLAEGKPLLTRRTFEQFHAKALEVSQRLLGYQLDEAQIRALFGIATSTSRLHVVTAGPGCGKTAIMEVFSAMMSHKLFEFTAPTGKAAKVLSARVERNGYTASTMHSTLKGSPEGGFAMNRNEQLDCEILVVDESTMPTVELFEAATAAMRPGAHLILLGDPGVDGLAGQLPSIGAGRVLSDILNLPGVDHHHLTATKRNSGGILEAVNEVRNYSLACEDRQGVTFSHGLPSASVYFQEVAAKYLELVAQKGIENVVLLMSRRASNDPEEPTWCTDFANPRLRDMLNPHAVRIPGTTLHVNDRIVIRENMTLGEQEDGGEVRVVNGDTGTITRFQPHTDEKRKGAQYVVIKLDDGRFIQFPGESTKDLQLGYAGTVHFSQGSEYKDVLLVMTPGQPSFVNANMFLTGMSRAREGLWIYGDDAELRKIAATRLPERNTTLVERVAELVQDNSRPTEGAAASEAPRG